MIQYEEVLHLLGGTDINPLRYDEKPLPTTQKSDDARDELEFSTAEQYITAGIPIIGVCRGAQLLCVLNGGKLWQDSTGHGFSHGIDTTSGYINSAAAGHHQIMRLDDLPEEDYKILAWCPYSTTVIDGEGNRHVIDASPEIVWFPKTKCLAIQPHPEWEESGTSFQKYANKLVKELIGIDNFF